MRTIRYSEAALRIGLAAQLAVLGPAPIALAAPDVTTQKAPNDDATAIHVLNRLTFGPSPKDLARVRQLGVRAWANRW